MTPRALPPSDLLGRSDAMAAVRSFLRRAAGVDVPVVLEGETGTGKTLAARLLHRMSGRADGPFVAVNCAGIPEGLFESELFGHRRGAFTGAFESRVGLIEAADGGTLFLDEIGDLPGGQQAKLLTVLDDGRVRRVGSTEATPVDVRVVSATCQDLPERVAEGRFRPDLFHRIALLRCRLPPLRERPDDLEELAEHYVRRAGLDHLGQPGRLTPAALQRLLRHGWPGNVRELAHLLEAALILRGRPLLDRAHLEPLLVPERVGG